MKFTVANAPVIIKFVLVIPKQLVSLFLDCFKPLFPQPLSLVIADYTCYFGKAVHIICKETRKINTIHFLSFIKPRSVIHAGFAASAQRIVIHLPLRQAVAVNITVVYIPLQIFAKRLINIFKKLFVSAKFVKLQSRPAKGRRLRDRRLPCRRYHMRQKTVLMFKLKHCFNALLGKFSAYMFHTDGMICSIPQPHCLMRKAVGSCP